MSDPREQVLANVRAALNRVGPLPESVAGGLRGRLARPRANLKPAIGADPIAHFIEKLESVSGKVTRVAGIDKVAEVVAGHLQSFDLGDSLVAAPDPALLSIAYSVTPSSIPAMRATAIAVGLVCRPPTGASPEAPGARPASTSAISARRSTTRSSAPW